LKKKVPLWERKGSGKLSSEKKERTNPSKEEVWGREG